MGVPNNSGWRDSTAETFLRVDNTSLITTALTYSCNNMWSALVCVFLGLLVWDQVVYLRKKGSIAGPKLKIWPIVGPFFNHSRPTFEQHMSKWNSGKLSCVSVFHKFVIIASDRDLCCKILNSPFYAKPCLVDIAKRILGPNNLVFLDGRTHIDYRKSLNPLLTRQAVGVYLPSIEIIYNKYLVKFTEISTENAQPFIKNFHEFNCAISLAAFCGDYISEQQVKHISDNYHRISEALELVSFPIILPFTKAWYGKKIGDKTMEIFADCARRARIDVANGSQPTCLLESWLKQQHDALHNKGPSTKSPVRSFSDEEISETIFSFLFGGQDPTSSATTWLFQIMADRPDIMKRVREEQLRIRNRDISVPLSIELVDQMEYTNRVVKETLRHRPPFLMVPHVIKRDFHVTENYKAPKNSMIIPAVYPALHDAEVYENPDEFDPDRWLPDTVASKAYKNWLVFGYGPHICIGQHYVYVHLAALIGTAALFYDWRHTVTEKSEDIEFFAAIVPEDGCILQFRRRSNKEILSEESL